MLTVAPLRCFMWVVLEMVPHSEAPLWVRLTCQPVTIRPCGPARMLAATSCCNALRAPSTLPRV